jgi:hypothetical protein
LIDLTVDQIRLTEVDQLFPNNLRTLPVIIVSGPF